MAARTTVTLTATVPARLAHSLGLAAGDQQDGDVLLLPHRDAWALVQAGVGRFGSAAQEAATPSTLGTPAPTAAQLAADPALRAAFGAKVNEPASTSTTKTMFEGPVMLDRGGALGSGNFTIGVDPARARWSLDTKSRTFYPDYQTGFGIALPPGVLIPDRLSLVRQGNEYYIAMFGPTTASAAVWRSTDFSMSGWSKVLDLTANGSTEGTSAPFPTTIATDGASTLVGEYGDPKVGDARAPHIWRTFGDAAHGYGTVWDLVYTGSGGMRHIHAIEFDPYNPGHVWATTGDGDVQAKILRSTDSGVTWSEVFSGDARFQGVQISFSPTHVWIASDADAIPAIVLSRTDLVPKIAARNSHSQIAVPGGAPGDTFHSQAFFGAYDSETGHFYYVTCDAGNYGNRHGAFYIDRPGGSVHLITPLPDRFVPSRVYLTGTGTGRTLWSGNTRIDVGAASLHAA